MGTIAARKAMQIVENTETVLAMELMTGLQAIDFKDNAKMSNCTKRVYDYIRKHIPFIEEDTIMYKHIHIAKELVHSREFELLIKGECD